ncbi:hypothetical protein MPSEU_000226700 [Mayamaea pseudoterrestris]|nr:hypothetical protein MPSEU_000226700 [Mayamaea pseudoterrestris]
MAPKNLKATFALQQELKSNNDDANQHVKANGTSLRSYTLYLIRHGEAFHNVQEKIAEKEAEALALAQGLSPAEVHLKMMLARQRILDDPAFFDSPLTAGGIQQAHEASAKLYSMIFPLPTEVFVSPLQRTLQTAAHLFVPEHHSNVRVREELRERLTGRPADNRYSSSVLASRKSFARFSFKNLRQNSLKMEFDIDSFNGSDEGDSELLPMFDDMGNVHLGETADEDDSELPIDGGDDLGPDFGLGIDIDVDPMASDLDRSECRTLDASATSMSSSMSSSRNVQRCMELEKDLQIRAGKLLSILCDSESCSVAVLSHKAYLRALERGVFGREEASEFGNCEIRVYTITLDTSSKSLVKTERLL